jgi:hypothetical protein
MAKATTKIPAGFPAPAAPAQTYQPPAYWVYPGVRARIRRTDWGEHLRRVDGRISLRAVFEGAPDDLIRAGFIDIGTELPKGAPGCRAIDGGQATMCRDQKIRINIDTHEAAIRDRAFRRFMKRAVGRVRRVG